MTHNPFAGFKYKDSHQCWAGMMPLARFAAHGTRAAESPPTEAEAEQMLADMTQALDNMRGLLREKFGAKAEDTFAAIDAELERIGTEDETPEEPDPLDAEREQKRQVRAKKKAARLGRGEFAIRALDPDGDGPREEQAAAANHLLDREAAVLDAVLAQVWASFQDAYGQEHWRQIMSLKPAKSLAELHGRFALERVEVTPEHRGGFAHLVFSVDSDWQDEHGLFVVYSPDTGTATWTSFDGLDELLPTDEPIEDAEDYATTPHDELVEAVLNGEEARARELVAAGADINDLGPDEYPPLYMSVEHLEVEEVRRLLAFGADPNLTAPDEKKTPLKLARRLYKEMGFAPGKKQDALYEAMMALARETAGKQMDEMKERLDEIIWMLEDAGGK